MHLFLPSHIAVRFLLVGGIILHLGVPFHQKGGINLQQDLFLLAIDIHQGIIGHLQDTYLVMLDEDRLQHQGMVHLRLDANILMADDLHYLYAIGLLTHVVDPPFKIAEDHLLLDVAGTHLLLDVAETHLHLNVAGDHLLLDTEGDHLYQHVRDHLYQHVGDHLLRHIEGEHLPYVAEYHHLLHTINLLLLCDIGDPLLLHAIEDHLLQYVTCLLSNVGLLPLSNIDPCLQRDYLQMLLLNDKEDLLGVMVPILNYLNKQGKGDDSENSAT